MDNAKKNHSLTVEKLQEENKKTEEQLNETMMIRMKLEQHILDLEENFTDRDSHSFQKVPPMFERGSELFRNSFDEYNDPFAVNQNQDEPGAGPVSMRCVVRKVNDFSITQVLREICQYITFRGSEFLFL